MGKMLYWELLLSLPRRHHYLQLATRSTYAINSTNLSVWIILEDSELLFVSSARLYVTNLSQACDSFYWQPKQESSHSGRLQFNYLKDIYSGSTWQ
jgi:hypothetical protein